MIKKILCIGQYKKPSNAYLRTLSFEQLGYKVERIDVSDKISGHNIILRILRRLYRPTLIRVLVKLIKKKIDSFSPDLIFIEKGVQFSAKNLIFFKSSVINHIKLVHLNPDDPFGEFGNGWGKFVSSIPFYDIHFVPKEINRSEYLKLGAQSVYVYDRSFSPNYHKPVNLSKSEVEFFGCRVGFIGAFAPYRESVIYTMICEGINVAIWGDGWSNGKYWNKLKHYWRGGSQVGEDYPKAISGMEIALHFVRHENRDLQDSRTFEIPACGSFMLAERTADHEHLFVEDLEAVFFNSPEECIEKCRYYLENAGVRKKIAEAGMQRVHNSNYDYTSRLKEMIEATNNNDIKKSYWNGVR